MPEPSSEANDHRHHINRLLKHLPAGVRRVVERVLQPEASWFRIPLGVLLIACGFLGFLPVLGFWMIPLGALLLAEDIPIVRKYTVHAIEAVERWWRRRQERA